MQLHSAKISQFVAIAVTVVIELLFSFLGSWTLYDVFTPWGQGPAVIIALLFGSTLFLLYMYCYIFREYAIEGVREYNRLHGRRLKDRLMWATILAWSCVVIDTAFNIDRLLALPGLSLSSRLLLGAGLQILVLVPFALGALVHAHVNSRTARQMNVDRFAAKLDTEVFDRLNEILPMLTTSEIISVRNGDMLPIQKKLAAQTARDTDPLAAVLAGLFGQPAQIAAPAPAESERNTDTIPVQQ